MKIKNVFKRCMATAMAAAIGVTTLGTSASAITSGVNIGYMWNSNVNPTIYTTKYAATGGVSGQYVKYGEQLCRFVSSTNDDWVFCIEPAKSMQGSNSGSWFSQNGFNEYDTLDETDQNTADSLSYWNALGGTNGPLSKYMGLVQYYGYSSHKTGDYYAATQLLIWELILGYRGHSTSTFGTCSDVLWNDFIYPSGGWCTKAGVEKAYNDIVANVKTHYDRPESLSSTKAKAKEEPALIIKYNSYKLRYEASFSISTAFLKPDSLAHNFSTIESKLTDLVKSKFSGTFGKDYGIDKSEADGNTTFTVWSVKRPFTSTSDATVYTSDAVEMQMRNDLKKQESLFCKSGYQTCLLSTKLDPVSGYISMAAYNEPDLKVEKTYTDSHNNAVTATALGDLLAETSFIISTKIGSKIYYVSADPIEKSQPFIFVLSRQSRVTMAHLP